METSPPTSTLSPQDERIIAALGHIAILLPLMGIIAPIVIWITQKERSRFVSFQALQAIAFQLLMIVIWFVGMACYMGSFFLTFFSMMAAGSQGSGDAPLAFLSFIVPFVVMFGMIAVMGIFVIYGVIAAVLTFQGKDFRYLLVGQWVERYTQRASAL